MLGIFKWISNNPVIYLKNPFLKQKYTKVLYKIDLYTLGLYKRPVNNEPGQIRVLSYKYSYYLLENSKFIF